MPTNDLQQAIDELLDATGLGRVELILRKVGPGRYLARYYTRHILNNPFDRAIRATMRQGIQGDRLRGRGLHETIRAGDCAVPVTCGITAAYGPKRVVSTTSPVNVVPKILSTTNGCPNASSPRACAARLRAGLPRQALWPAPSRPAREKRRIFPA